MRHLTQEQRYEIYGHLHAGLNKAQIASMLGVHKSTVPRELASEQLPGHEELLSRTRTREGRATPQGVRVALPPQCPEHGVRDRLRAACRGMQLSPEQIVGHCRRNEIRMCSHEPLYKWIWGDKRRGGDLYRHLRHRGRKYAKRGAVNNSRSFIKDAVDISERPAEVEARGRFGDFEVDTIVGKNHQQHILTVVERKVRKVWLRRLREPSARETVKMMVDALSPLVPGRLVKTITSDNGSQFSHHKKISKELRADFGCYSDEDLRRIEDKLNNRPRKILNLATPNEVLIY